MSPYKNFLNAATVYLNSNSFLRFLLTAYIFVFALGGLLFVLGAFIIGVMEVFTCLGTILMLAGLLLTLIKEDVMTLAITSAAISFLALLAWIFRLAGVGTYGYGSFLFTPLFYFLAFGAIALVVFLKADKFKQMRAASAARAQMAGVPCANCGAFVPMNSGFCPNCGAPNPATQQYAPPQQPQYAPPQQPQYAPPQAAPAAPKCVNCGADLAPGAAFCPNCGAKQQ